MGFDQIYLSTLNLKTLSRGYLYFNETFSSCDEYDLLEIIIWRAYICRLDQFRCHFRSLHFTERINNFGIILWKPFTLETHLKKSIYHLFILNHIFNYFILYKQNNKIIMCLHNIRYTVLYISSKFWFCSQISVIFGWTFII